MKKFASALAVCALLGGATWLGSTSTVDAYALPSVDSLDAHSDYSVFMKDGVADDVRVRALRKLWRVHPVIGKGDDLTDYGADVKGTDLTRGETAAIAPIVRLAAATYPATTAIELPSIDSLTADSDYSVFMQPGVPAGRRNQALRKLWASDPAIVEGDDLSDYGDDYRSAG